MDEAAVVPENLPGAEIVTEGLSDLAAGRDSVSSLAVSMASIRLRAAGLDVPPIRSAHPASHRLYELLARADPPNAHSHYNAIVRRIVSFARAAEHARGR